MHKHISRRGFTLVELITVVGVVGVLSAVLYPAITSFRARSYAAREAAAGAQLGRAYLLASEGEGNRLMPGYHTGAAARRPNGAAIYGPPAARYPWRLAPYVDFQFEGSMYVNEGAAELNITDEYMTSLRPSFGINAYCVGGYNDGSGSYQYDVARRPGDAPQPSRLVAFASARMTPSESTAMPGNHMITPPRIGSMNWSRQPGAHASTTGNVDFRHDGQAVVVFLDGHVEMLDSESLRDMRRWSPGAQKADNPNYTVPASPPVVPGSSGTPGRRR